jgi:CheY-specific phosphatase CheX
MTTAALATPTSTFPKPLEEAVKKAVELTFSVFLGEAPKLLTTPPEDADGSGVVGIISYLGDINWSLALILPERTASAMALKFCGMEVDYHSTDMGDVVGELANVLAGDVVAQCEARRVKTAMSLPMVARGTDFELLTPGAVASKRIEFTSSVGDFWFRMTQVKSGMSAPGRKPGT